MPLDSQHSPSSNSFKEEKRVSFQYLGTTFTGVIVSSTINEPHYHWFMFDDEQMVNIFGDSIGFKEINGSLEAINLYVNRTAIVQEVMVAVAAHIGFGK